MSYQVDEFWKKNEKTFASSHAYFAQKYGAQILKKTIASVQAMRGRILDFGCGPGFFVDQLCAAGWDAEGAEVAVATGEKKSTSPRFRRPIHNAAKLPLGIPPGHFKHIFLMEVLEHLDDHNLDSVLKEVVRLAAPASCTIVVTTPNSENLEESSFSCPHCGQSFHRWQHVRSFNKKSLGKLMEAYGWEIICCEEVNWERPARTIKNFLRRALFLDDRTKHKPHLFFAGRIRANHPKR